jgi:4-carboxymuconolactone decarboxylase
MPPQGALTTQQRAAVEAVAAGPRGELLACFVPFLRSPELMTRVQHVGEYVRYGSVLDEHLVELVVLCVARCWDQEFEWWVHRPLAEAAGLGAEVIAAVGAGSRPEGATPEVLAVVDLVHDLHTLRDVSDDTYRAALTALDEVRVVEAVATTGYYVMLAMMMNAAHTPAPPGPRLPPRTGPYL